MAARHHRDTPDNTGKTPDQNPQSLNNKLSANTTGISVYVLGLDDKTYLARTYGGSIGKASVTGYCIKFRHLAVISVDALHAAIQYGMSVHQAG